MTESQWLLANDGDAMLGRVQDRLSPRKWSLLACGVARRLWEVYSEDAYLEAIRWREEHPLIDSLPPGEAEERLNRLQAMLPEAIRRAEINQQAIVAICDPMAPTEDFPDLATMGEEGVQPVLAAASTFAMMTTTTISLGVETAQQAFQLLYTESGALLLGPVRQLAIESLVYHTRTGLTTALALELKADGDEMAEQKPVTNRRYLHARAQELVQQKGETMIARAEGLEQEKARADRKALGRLLLEQLGNPFKPYRFEPRWRTEAVVGLARSIDEDRRFELYPILLDALLDADCIDEAILNHLRGTDSQSPNPSHACGCWVIDLILEKEPEFFALPPLKSQSNGPGMPLGLSEDAFV